MTGTDHGSLRPATSRAFFGILTKVVVLAIMAVGLTAPYGYAGPPTEAMKTTIDEVLHIIHEKELKQPAKSEERRKQLERPSVPALIIRRCHGGRSVHRGIR